LIYGEQSFTDASSFPIIRRGGLLMKYSIPRFRKRDSTNSKPVIIDAERDFRKDPVSGRMVYKTPSLKARFWLALQLLGGIALGITLFLILLPIAVLLAVAVIIFILLFLIPFRRRLHRIKAVFWNVHHRV
jgi:hypothetical protein